MTVELLGVSPGDGRDLVGWIRAVGRGGLPGVLIREPLLPEDALDRLVEAAVNEIGSVSVHLKNPHARVVAARHGARVHSPAPAEPLRWTELAGCGVSAHTAEEVERARAAGAAYVLLSPVWRPSSKPGDPRAPLGPERFLAIARGGPVLALGGVTPERFRALREAGAAGAAILGPLAGTEEEIALALGQYLARAA